MTAEATKEPTTPPEPSQEAENTEKIHEFPSEQANTDASEGDIPEVSTEQPKNTETALQGGSCQCQSVDPLSLSLGLGWFGLLLLRRRRRPFGSPPPSARCNA
jgi:MYXO-CTERM domain-containing protein